MRITHLSRFYLPHPGGVQRAMHEIARASAGRGDIVRAFVCADSPFGSRHSMDGVEVIRVPGFGVIQGVPIAPTYLALPRGDDVLHLHESFPLGTLAVLLRVRGRPSPALVVTWHFDVVRQRRLKRVHDALVRRVLERARVIHVPTEAHAERSPALAPFRAKVQVIPFIVDIARFRRSTDHPLARLIRTWAQGAPVALFVGRFVYYKGLPVLLDALAQLPELRLVLVGDGPLGPSLRRRATDAGIEARILWLGAVSDDDLVGAYSGADVFVLPSTEPIEAFGLVQVEAMASGLPVVSTRLGTGVEIVNADGETGLVVPPSDVPALADALRAVASGTALRDRLGRAALARSAGFSSDQLGARYADLYREAAADV